TGRFLGRQGIGILLPEASPDALEAAIGKMEERRFSTLKERVLSRNPRIWSYDRSDCRALVEKLRSLAAIREPFAAEALA
ncbi:glycosyl transferase family 1, partial [Mesorhizobium sp. BR1-1-7]|nr:glycosyl transferase family 1 [Mesorhizobium sp. BR1-1-7]